MELSFFSDIENIIILIISIVLLLLSFFIIKTKLDSMEKAFLICVLYFFVFALCYENYLNNFVRTPYLYSNIQTISNLRININTFKEHEHRLPKEKDFYLSGFLNDSQYFEIKNNKKVFAPIHNSNFKLKDDIDSLSFNYINYYDKQSFIQTQQAYRYCLNYPLNLINGNFEKIKVSINGKDFDYKKATKESMKDICYLGKPNNYQITFF